MKKLFLVLILSIIVNSIESAESCPKISQQQIPGLNKSIENLTFPQYIAFAEYLILEKKLSNINKEINASTSFDNELLTKKNKINKKLESVKNAQDPVFKKILNEISKTFYTQNNEETIINVYKQTYCDIIHKLSNDQVLELNRKAIPLFENKISFEV